jgi:Flp pilus assembly protein TadB
MVRLAACVAVAAAVGLLTRWPVGAVLAGIATWTLPRVLGADRAEQTALARTEAVAAWSEMLRDNLSAAAGLEQAIIAAAAVAPPAISDEATQLAASLRAGMRLPDALSTFREALADPTGDLVVRALSQASHRQASKLADLLAELAELARKRTGVRLRVAAGRARVRTSARVVTATTVAFAVALVALNRPYLAAYDSALGQLVLLLIGFLFAVGFAGLTRLGRIGDPIASTNTEPIVGDPA